MMGFAYLIILVFSIICLSTGILVYLEWRAEAQAKAEDKRLQRTNPRAWKVKELVELKRQRLAAEKELAADRLRQENARQNAGLLWQVGRLGGWW